MNDREAKMLPKERKAYRAMPQGARVVYDAMLAVLETRGARVDSRHRPGLRLIATMTADEVVRRAAQ